MRRGQTGFTLVEVLVATAVLALALTVFITGGTQYAGHAHYIQEKTLAQWVARNRMVEYDTDPQWPDTGRDDGTVEMGGREWEWQSEVEETQDPVVRRVDIQVFPIDADTGDAADSPLTTLSGFLTQPAGTAGATTTTR